MSNLSIIQRNIIHALDCETSEKAFLRACDRVNVCAAEAFALEVSELVRFLSYGLTEAARGHGRDEAPQGLLTFILERHWHSRFGLQARHA